MRWRGYNKKKKADKNHVVGSSMVWVSIWSRSLCGGTKATAVVTVGVSDLTLWGSSGRRHGDLFGAGR